MLQDKTDVLAMAGGRLRAKHLYFPIFLEDGVVHFQGKKCPGGYSRASRTVALTFSSLGVDNPMVSGIVLFRGALEETDFARQAAVKEEFDRAYEVEQKKKDFDKYYVLNKYAKQKKRKRNFLFDRSHHYETVIEEDNAKKGAGVLRPVLYVLALCGMVVMYFRVKSRVEAMHAGPSSQATVPKAEEGNAHKPKEKKKKK